MHDWVINLHFVRVTLTQVFIALGLLILYFKPPVYRLKIALLSAAVFLSLLSYYDFFRFQMGHIAHDYDFYHYYIGAKYFPENGYDQIYRATVIADALDDPYYQGKDSVHNLSHYYQTEVREDIVRQHNTILANFSSVRWAQFREDVSVWRQLYQYKWRQSDLFADHGYNGTPFMTAVLNIFIRVLPLSIKNFMNIISFFDLFLILIIAYIIWRWYGLEWGLLFICLWSINPLNDYRIIGGSFLRYLYFFSFSLALISFNRNRMYLSAIMLALSTCLRLFPGLWVGLLAVYHLWKWRHIAAERRGELKRFYSCFALSFIAMIAFSLLIMAPNGELAWLAFFRKIEMHAANGALNLVGFKAFFMANLKPMTSYCLNWPEGVPCYELVKDRLASLQAYAPFFYFSLLTAVVGGLFYLRRCRSEAELMLLGYMLALVGLGLSSYDYVILSLLPFLYPQQPRMLCWFLLGLLSLQILFLVPMPLSIQYLIITLFILGLYIAFIVELKKPFNMQGRGFGRKLRRWFLPRNA